MTNAAEDQFSASYSYLANSSLIDQILYRSNSIVRMTANRRYDNLGRLLETAATPGASGAEPLQYRYTYNQANQRVQIEDPDGAYWRYQYDKLGQVKSGKKSWSDGTPVAGQQFTYAFDDIGNRTATERGGDYLGNGLESASYSANNLVTTPSGGD